MTTRSWQWIGVAILGLTVVMTDVQLGQSANISPAVGQAQVLRHGNVLSVAAVIRRTVVRKPANGAVVVRRSTIYVNTLPAGCVRRSYGGTTVWKCGSTYYQPYGGTRYVVVYIN
jgi:hypothetical protein